MDNINPAIAQPKQLSSEEQFQVMCEQLKKVSAEGDIAGFCRQMEGFLPQGYLAAGVMKKMRLAVNNAGQRGTAEMLHAVFGEMMGFTAILVLRAQNAALDSMTDYDSTNGGRGGLPTDFVENTLPQLQQLHAYMVKLAESYARLSHVLGLSRRRSDKRSIRFKNQTVELDAVLQQPPVDQPVAETRAAQG